MKKFIIVILTFLIFLLLTSIQTDQHPVRVVKVHDGDTLTVLVDGEEMRVRLYGIDSPELRQPYGRFAKQHLQSLVVDQELSMIQVDSDQYQRAIVRLFDSDDKEINQELVRRGSAFWYYRYAPERLDLRTLEVDAKRERLGVWQQKKPVKPWLYRAHNRSIKR